MTLKFIQGHIRPLVCQNHSNTFVYNYEQILMEICMNANIMKIHFFHEIILYDLKCHIYVMEKFCDCFSLRPYDLSTTLTYVLMHNFSPFFFNI